MTPYESNTTLTAIADKLRAAKRIVITTHAKPDGDALGSVVALAEALEAMGKTAERWIMPPIPGNLSMLARDGHLHLHETEADPLPEGEPDAIVIVDTGAWTQLAPMRAWLEPRRDRAVLLDHHLRGDDVAALRYIDSSAAAAALIVAALIDELGVEYDDVMRDAIYVGIASDTGWFRFSNTTAATHELAARLLRLGVDHAELYSKLEQAERPEKLQLMIRALDSLKLVADGNVAVMTLRRSDFEDTGAMQEETERLVDLPQVVGDVQVVVLITETDNGTVRLSFRSKPGDDAVDVNEMARQFGGGGHARAAGAKVEAPLAEVRRKVLEAAEQLRGARVPR